MAASFQHRGFSLVEILITLSIMGVVAVFAIPKVLDSGNNSTSNSAKQTTMAREVAFMILNAYEQYKAANVTVPTTMRAADLTPYMNYVSVLPPGTQLDSHAGTGGIASSCAGGTASQNGVCLRLHNGGALFANTTAQFGSAINPLTPNSRVTFRFDPNATYEGAVNDASGMGIQLILYYDGVIRTTAKMRPNTKTTIISDGSTFITSSVGNEDPSWFTGF